MAKLNNKKMIAHINKTWGVRGCPMCGNKNWTVQASLFELREYHEGTMVIGGPVFPVVPVVCTNCGNTILINAVLADVVSDISGDKEGE